MKQAKFLWAIGSIILILGLSLGLSCHKKKPSRPPQEKNPQRVDTPKNNKLKKGVFGEHEFILEKEAILYKMHRQIICRYPVSQNEVWKWIQEGKKNFYLGILRTGVTCATIGHILVIRKSSGKLLRKIGLINVSLWEDEKNFYLSRRLTSGGGRWIYIGAEEIAAYSQDTCKPLKKFIVIQVISPKTIDKTTFSPAGKPGSWGSAATLFRLTPEEFREIKQGKIPSGFRQKLRGFCFTLSPTPKIIPLKQPKPNGFLSEIQDKRRRYLVNNNREVWLVSAHSGATAFVQWKLKRNRGWIGNIRAEIQEDFPIDIAPGRTLLFLKDKILTKGKFAPIPSNIQQEYARCQRFWVDKNQKVLYLQGKNLFPAHSKGRYYVKCYNLERWKLYGVLP